MVDFISLPASQPPADGLWGVTPSEPSHFFPLCWLKSWCQIYTPIHSAATSQFAPQCFQVTGWGTEWHHTTACHLEPSLMPCWDSWQLQAGLCVWGLTSGPACATQKEVGRCWHWQPFYTTSRFLSIVFSIPKMCLRACVQAHTRRLVVFPMPLRIRDSYLWVQLLCTRLCPCTCAAENVTSRRTTALGEETAHIETLKKWSDAFPCRRKHTRAKSLKILYYSCYFLQLPEISQGC